MAPLFVFFVVATGAAITWQYATCQRDYDLFQTLFNGSLKEEIHVSFFGEHLSIEMQHIFLL